MLKLIVLAFLIPQASFAFILINTSYRLAKPSNTSFKISSEGCTAAGISDAILEANMRKAMELWNDVPESRLKFKFGGTSGTSVASGTIPAGEVIVGCEAMGAGDSSGVTNLDIANGSARIRMDSDDFSGSDMTGFFGVLTHELGHAVGLTHSKDPASVMTYEANGWVDPKYLSEDDAAGVVYLYPNKDKQLAGLLAGCSSYASEGPTSPAPFAGNLLAGFATALAVWALARWVARMFRVG